MKGRPEQRLLRVDTSYKLRIGVSMRGETGAPTAPRRRADRFSITSELPRSLNI